MHRKARGLAQLRTSEGLADPRLIGHSQGSEGTRVGRIALGALEPPCAEVLGAHRIDDRDRDCRPMERCGERHPIVPAGLHHHPLDRPLSREPALELGEPGAIGTEAQDRPVRGPLTRSTDRRDVLALADVDANAVHRSPSPRFSALGELAGSGPRLLIVDHRPARTLPQSPDHRPRTECEGRTLVPTALTE